MNKLTEILESLLKPLVLIINRKANSGDVYTKSEVDEMLVSDSHINSLIDSKIGVIENGTY